MSKEDCANKRHLFIKIDGEYYFIPAESLGCPLDCDDDEVRKSQLEAKAAAFLALATEDGSKATVEFAVWLKRCELLWGIFGGKS